MTETQAAMQERTEAIRAERAKRTAHIEKLARQGLPLRQISERVKCSQTLVSRTAKELGLTLARACDWEDA